MPTIEWNRPEEKTYESGLDRGVLYPKGGLAVPWNGLISVESQSDGGELDSYYWDGKKFLDFVYAEDFQASLSAFSSPPAFRECEGIKTLAPGLHVPHQRRNTFGLTYRTGLGNELEGDDYGYYLHLVWGCTAAPSSRSYQTRTDSVELGTRTWDISTVPPPATTYKPTAYMRISSVEAGVTALRLLENYLYDYGGSPRLPTQAQVISTLQTPG